MKTTKNTLALATAALFALPTAVEAVPGKPGIKLQHESRTEKSIDDRRFYTERSTTRRVTPIQRQIRIQPGVQSPSLQRKFSDRIQPQKSYSSPYLLGPGSYLTPVAPVRPTSTYDRFESNIGQNAATARRSNLATRGDQ